VCAVGVGHVQLSVLCDRPRIVGVAVLACWAGSALPNVIPSFS
jgi:hypothetical protein